MTGHASGEGTLAEIWLTGAAAAEMQRISTSRLLAGRGVEGDRYALGGGTWERYPALEKQVTLIDRHEVAAVAQETGTGLSSGQTRRNLVTEGIELPRLLGRWFTVGDALLLGVKRCPPCTHLERLTGLRLVKAMAHRGGINAAVFAGASIAEGAPVRMLSDEEAQRRGAPVDFDRSGTRSVR